MCAKDITRVKIFHGPNGTGGIGGRISKYQRREGLHSDFVTYHNRARAQNHDYDLRVDDHNIFARAFIVCAFFLICLIKYDIFHFYFGRSFFFFGLEMPILKLFRKKIIVTFCGSDIRLFNDVEKKRNPYIDRVKHKMNSPIFDQAKKMMLRWQNLWVDKFFAIRLQYASARVIVPEHKVIKDIWINSAMDIDAYEPNFETHEIPTLVHASTVPSIKGSDIVEKIIEELKSEGHQLKYLQLNQVPNHEAQRIYREEADIIIDQFYLGSFGQFAIEGMYAGKPVCSYVMEDIAQDIPDLPIVNCTIEGLKEKLIWLINNPQERIRIGKESRAFVQRHCDIKNIHMGLLDVYKEILGN